MHLSPFATKFQQKLEEQHSAQIPTYAPMACLVSLFMKLLRQWVVWTQVRSGWQSHCDFLLVDPMASLSLETQLNVEADKLTMEFLQANKLHQPITLLFPWAECQLIVNEKLITSSYQEVLKFVSIYCNAFYGRNGHLPINTGMMGMKQGTHHIDHTDATLLSYATTATCC
jgi:hypothetical protein